MAYVFTVVQLVAPFFLVSEYLIAMMATLIIAIAIIAFFNYYVSVARDEGFKRRFMEMVMISLGVAAISFIIGYLVYTFIGINL